MCLSFVRSCYGIPLPWPWINPTAAKAWATTPAEHRHKWTGDVDDIPYGAPVFSHRPGAGKDDAGHVFITGAHNRHGQRIFRSNDIAVTGGISPVTIDAFTEKWGHEILGWVDVLNGYALNLPDSPNERERKRNAHRS